MGQELPYRYQEHLIAELLNALRGYRARFDRVRDDATPGQTSTVRRVSH
jgi:hypothetical protein